MSPVQQVQGDRCIWHMKCLLTVAAPVGRAEKELASLLPSTWPLILGAPPPPAWACS